MTTLSTTGPEPQIVNWIQQHVGPVRAIRRQQRWRPSWYVDATVGGRKLTLYVRGERGGNWPPQPLSYEYRVHQIFEASAMRVPHLHGFIENPRAIVMELLPGRANMRTLEDETARESIRSQLIDQMIKMHSLDPEPLRAAGAIEPEDPRRRGMAYYDQAEQIYLLNKSRPEPQLEFLRKWMARNLPTPATRAEVVAVDAGQFIYDGDRLTGLIDFEMAGLGDRYTDLGSLRTRDRAEYIGDLNRFYALYAQRAGMVLDIRRIRYHALAIAMLTPLMIASQLAKPALDQDYYIHLLWWATNGKEGLEELAEILGVDLPAWTAPPVDRRTRYDLAFEAMTMWLGEGAKGEGHAAYEMRRKLALAGFMRRSDRYQSQFDREYFDDIFTLTGKRPMHAVEADTLLEGFVRQAGPEYDQALLHLFYRQMRRHCFLVDDPEAPNPRLSTRIPPLKDIA